MSSKMKLFLKLVVAAVIIFLPLQVFADMGGKKADKDATVTENQKTSEKLLDYSSNQFTQPEKLAGLDQTKAPTTGALAGFDKVAENDHLVLYVNKKSLEVKIQDKTTGYIWDSGVDDYKKYQLNKTWGELAQSALTIDYVDRQGKEKTESILTNDSEPDIQKIKDGFRATVNFFQARISVQMDVKLDGDSLQVTIPHKGIQESKYDQLISLKVYPFLGAEYMGQTDGYMFIPDGSGALIRYQDTPGNADTPFVTDIYGKDSAFEKTIADDNQGLDNVTSPQLIQMPVYGVVHGVKQNGFLAVVEDGASFAQIVAYPAGVTTNFNWITTQYNYRYQYFQPTSKDMNGVNLYQKKKNNFDIKLRFMFLEKNDADYVGMAKRYQHYLVDKGILSKKKSDKVNVRLEFLGGEVKKGLIWNSVIPMTKVTDIPKDVQTLRSHDVKNMMVVYKGWSSGGLTGTLPEKFPVEKNLGNKDDVKSVVASLHDQNIPMYFSTDYTTAYDGANGYSGKDVAKKISSETLTESNGDYPYYYLSPKKSVEHAKGDMSDYKDYGIKNVAIDSTGYELFSDYNHNTPATRPEAVKDYQDIFKEFKAHSMGLALYQPSVYAWKETDRYLNIPIHSSYYSFATDTVPFLEIVLKGYIPYYAPFSNYNADQQDDLLRIIDYGANPSFLLTNEPSNLLKDTPSKDVFTSEFKIWKDEIVHQYKMVYKSLGQVAGETYVGRDVLAAGVVKDSYSNGKSIIINYTEQPYVDQGDHVTVKANNIAVVDGKDSQ